MDKVALEQVFLPALRFFPVHIIPQIHRASIYLNTAVINRTGERRLRTFKQNTGRKGTLMSVSELCVCNLVF